MQREFAVVLEHLLGQVEEVLDQLVIVGGACIPLWVDDPAAPPARPTNDIDLVAAVASRAEYYRLSERLRELGLEEDSESNVLCRWRGTHGAIFDVMPLDAGILGFSNRWYADTFDEACHVTLPGGLSVRAGGPAYLIATKFVAFDHRGGGDWLASHDVADVISLLDGRRSIVDDVVEAREPVSHFVAARLEQAAASGDLHTAIIGNVPPDADSQARVPVIEEIAREIVIRVGPGK